MNTYQVYWDHLDPDQRPRTFKASTRGKAKYQAYKYYSCDGDSFDFKDFLKDLVCKCVGRTKPSDYFSCLERFERVKKNRNIPFAFQGMRIETGGRKGFITGGNDSGNIDVLFDGWEHVSNCHPWWDIKYFGHKNKVIAEYGKD